MKSIGEVLSRINWSRIVIAVVLVQVLGIAWYITLFGSVWTQYVQPTEAQQFDLKSIGGIVNSVVMIVGLAWLFARLEVSSWMRGLKVSLVACVVFSLTVLGIGYFYESRQLVLVLIDAGYQLLSFAIVGMVLGRARGR